MITLHCEGQRRVPTERVHRAYAEAGGCAAARDVEGGTDLPGPWVTKPPRNAVAAFLLARCWQLRAG
eukprot:scaffold11381_cov68-Phaeocystis_antarctica.AAC.3